MTALSTISQGSEACRKKFDRDRVELDKGYLFNQDKSKFDYLNELFPIKYTDNISNISYRIQHYPDKSKIPLDFLFKLIIANSRNVNVQYEAIKHLADLERLNSYAVVNHFLFSVKYLVQN